MRTGRIDFVAPKKRLSAGPSELLPPTSLVVGVRVPRRAWTWSRRKTRALSLEQWTTQKRSKKRLEALAVAAPAEGGGAAVLMR
jgi:hypothetical protein